MSVGFPSTPSARKASSQHLANNFDFAAALDARMANRPKKMPVNRNAVEKAVQELGRTLLNRITTREEFSALNRAYATPQQKDDIHEILGMNIFLGIRDDGGRDAVNSFIESFSQNRSVDAAERNMMVHDLNNDVMTMHDMRQNFQNGSFDVYFKPLLEDVEKYGTDKAIESIVDNFRIDKEETAQEPQETDDLMNVLKGWSDLMSQEEREMRSEPQTLPQNKGKGKKRAREEVVEGGYDDAAATAASKRYRQLVQVKAFVPVHDAQDKKEIEKIVRKMGKKLIEAMREKGGFKDFLNAHSNLKSTAQEAVQNIIAMNILLEIKTPEGQDAVNAFIEKLPHSKTITNTIGNVRVRNRSAAMYPFVSMDVLYWKYSKGILNQEFDPFLNHEKKCGLDNTIKTVLSVLRFDNGKITLDPALHKNNSGSDAGKVSETYAPFDPKDADIGDALASALFGRSGSAAVVHAQDDFNSHNPETEAAILSAFSGMPSAQGI